MNTFQKFGLSEPKFTPPSTQPPAFGHACRQLFSLHPDWLHLNNGSYGTVPTAIQDVIKDDDLAAWLDVSNALPDLFHKVAYEEPLNRARARVAEMIHTDADNVVLTHNSTLAANTVLRSILWKPKDVIISFGTTYNACASTLQYLEDRCGIRNEIIELNYPIENEEVLDLVRKRIKALKDSGVLVKAMLLDAISSRPGVLVPWKQCVDICRDEQVISVVDGAHAIGQIPLDMDATKPDFFFSNTHKWLYAHRGSCFIYVDPKHQDIVQSLPTTAAYVPDDAPRTKQRFQDQFIWPGSTFFGTLLSIEAAIDFRKWIGGEEAIMTYNNRLAKEGGKLVADMLGTEIMQGNKSDLVTSMVNVRLPLDLSSSERALDSNTMKELFRMLLHDHQAWGNIFL